MTDAQLIEMAHDIGFDLDRLSGKHGALFSSALREVTAKHRHAEFMAGRLSLHTEPAVFPPRAESDIDPWFVAQSAKYRKALAS